MVETESTPPNTQATAPPSDPGGVYLDLMRHLEQTEAAAPPATPEEAAERILTARDAYEALAPPEVDMPDTPPRSLSEILTERQRQYWMDRGEIREGNMKYVSEHVGLEDSPNSNALRLITNMPAGAEVPGDVLMWGVAKTMLAGKVWQEIQSATRFRRDRQLNLDVLTGHDYSRGLASVMQGRARIEIHGGQAQLVPSDYTTAARELSEEIHRRHLSIEERHKIIKENRKLKVAIPFLRDVLSSARSLWAVSDLAQFHYGEYYRKPAAANSEKQK